MTVSKENVNTESSEQDAVTSADLLSLEFQRDSRRYCRKLDCEVEE